MRLDKYLNDMTGEGRSTIKKNIKAHLVSVDGTVVTNSDMQVEPGQNNIVYKGKPLQYQSNYYYILNKPAGVVSATKDDLDQTVIDLLKDDVAEVIKKQLFPVGRLDKDTEGLLLLTNDGELSHNLLAPGKHIPKTYYVKTAHSVNLEAASLLCEGVDIGEKDLTKPAKVQIIADKEILLTITEGKFHQVKRMLQAVDNEVVYLKRISMGNLSLPEDLNIGDYRELTEIELNQLKQ